jgi:hypothetical protein
MMAGINIVSQFVETDEGWDHPDTFDIQLYKAKLAQDIGHFKKGEVVETIFFMGFLDGDRATIQIFHKKEIWEFTVTSLIVNLAEGKLIPQDPDQ